MQNFSIEELRNILARRHYQITSETHEIILGAPAPADSDDGSSWKGIYETFPSCDGNDPKENDPISEVSSKDIVDEIRTRQKSIYGYDDRVEVLNCTIERRKTLARSVAAIIPRSRLFSPGGDEVDIGSATLAQRYAAIGKPLCDREAFRDQPSSAIGSAFLVTPNIVATAHHCLNENNATLHCLIFEFELGRDGIAPTKYPVDQVYPVKRFLDGNIKTAGEDWALVELERPVDDRDPLVLREDGAPEEHTPLFVIGHPSGLPKKIAGNAEIRDNSIASHFVANLDTYGGNSGSPVFNAVTNQVEAILVRGAADFVPMGNCYSSLICPITGCRGEDCSRISDVVKSLQLSALA